MSLSQSDGGMFTSPADPQLDNFNIDYTPDLDYLDGADGFEFEDADLGGEMIGALPGSGPTDTHGGSQGSNGDGHEKRKSPDENDGAPEGDAKRQETEEGERAAKKPGRKPLTTEPTTKRKAQNRAAQRAFRERKEKHLKDLEEKVKDLTKTSEAEKQENGILKAQVQRLQTELRDYRKRLALNSSMLRGSPPSISTANHTRGSAASSYGSDFQFDFPKFGPIPGGQLFAGDSLTGMQNTIMQSATLQSPTTVEDSSRSQSQSLRSRQPSMGRSASPRSAHGSNKDAGAPTTTSTTAFAPYSTNDNMHGFASTMPITGVEGGALSDLFSPNLLKSADVNEYFNEPPNNASQPGHDTDQGGDSTSGLNRVFQFNGWSSASDSTSPSTSSLSQWNVNGNANSSCGTSPEPSHDSPALKDKATDSSNDKTSVQKQSSTAPTSHAESQTGMNSMFGLGNDDFTPPSLESFDPVLFGDYRDHTTSNEFGGFFDDALNSGAYDFNSPSNLFGILQSPPQTNAALEVNNAPSSSYAPSRNLMADVEKTCNGGDDDYGLPGSQKKKESGKFISCNNIWTQLQSNPDFQEGKFDLDSLCSELRVKAKCSESGVMVDQEHVNEALRKLGQKDSKTGKPYDVPPLEIERESW